MSCVNAISIIWMVWLSMDISDQVYSCMTPCMYTMFGHRFATHLHRAVLHIDDR